LQSNLFVRYIAVRTLSIKCDIYHSSSVIILCNTHVVDLLSCAHISNRHRTYTTASANYDLFSIDAPCNIGQRFAVGSTVNVCRVTSGNAGIYGRNADQWSICKYTCVLEDTMAIVYVYKHMLLFFSITGLSF